MEQSQCWAWTKQKDGLIRPSNIEDVSWEEQAFAKDAAGPHGGCIWPPRSYSCSFCRREFRSAQALGGHMNVHRRDRARLKQSHSNDLLLHVHHSPLQSSHIHEVYNPNPNLDFNTRVFVPSTKDNDVIQNTLVDHSSPNSMMVQKHHKINSSPFSYPTSWSNFVPLPYYRDSESRQENDKEIIIGSGFRAMEGCIQPDLSVSLISHVCRKRAAEEEEEESYSNKRRASPLAFLIKSTSQEVLGLGSSSSFEEIDLELRLGDRPKVK